MREVQGGIITSALFIMAFSMSGLLRAVLHYISPLTVAVNIGIVGLSLYSSGMRCAHFLDFIDLNGFGPSPIPSLEVPHYKTRGFTEGIQLKKNCHGVLQPMASHPHSVLPRPCSSFSERWSCSPHIACPGLCLCDV